MIEIIQDIRQSDNWGKYLNSIGWDIFRTPGGVLMAYKKMLGRSFIKIQKPKVLSEEDIKEIDEFAKKKKYFLVKLEPMPGQDETLLSKSGFLKSYTPLSVPSTMYIDLTKSEADLWNNVSHSGKYSIHRAEREGVQIRYYENPTEEALSSFYEIFAQTAVRQKFYKLPFSEVLSRSKSFGRKSHLVNAYNNKGELMSGKLFLGHNDLVLYSIGGTADAGRKTKIGYELLWKAVIYLKSTGYKTLDLEGVDDSRFPFFTSHWAGFTHFKEKFGGEVVRFPYPYIKYSSKLLVALSKIITLPI